MLRHFFYDNVPPFHITFEGWLYRYGAFNAPNSDEYLQKLMAIHHCSPGIPTCLDTSTSTGKERTTGTNTYNKKGTNTGNKKHTSISTSIA